MGFHRSELRLAGQEQTHIVLHVNDAHDGKHRSMRSHHRGQFAKSSELQLLKHGVHNVDFSQNDILLVVQ